MFVCWSPVCASSLSRGTKALGFLQPPSVEPRRSAPEKPAKKTEIESEMHMSSSPTKVKFLEKIGVKICTWTVLQLHRRHLHSFLNLHEPKDEWEGSGVLVKFGDRSLKCWDVPITFRDVHSKNSPKQ